MKKQDVFSLFRAEKKAAFDAEYMRPSASPYGSARRYRVLSAFPARFSAGSGDVVPAVY
jgi:hypothetical protein